jgi:hypothetical protein
MTNYELLQAKDGKREEEEAGGCLKYRLLAENALISNFGKM